MSAVPRILYVGMKYDYGDRARGLSFEHYNFFSSLRTYCEKRGWPMMHYDFMERGQMLGLDAMTEELLAIVQKERPTHLFAVLFDFHKDPRHEVFRRISDLGTTTIHWFCDDHWRFEKYSSHVAPNFNFVCTTANSALPKYEKLGLGSRVIKTQWACNHELYVPHDVAKDIDISFVGQPHGNRVETVNELIRAGLPVQVFGQGWAGRPRLPFHQMVRVFSRSRINLNLSNASNDAEVAAQQIKGRTFEIPGAGGFLLTGQAENLGDYYKDGEEVAVFRSPGELVEKSKFYLANEAERERIAKNGYHRTLAEHTWHHRYDEIFRKAGILV